MNIDKNFSDVLIIGSGPAGMTAAIYASRGNVKTSIIEGPLFGGQLMYTGSIENYPGFFSADPAFLNSGPGLMMGMRKQTEELGVEFISDVVTSVIPEEGDNKLFQVKCESSIHYAKTVIIATGSASKWLELPLEEKYKGHAISTCATCDGFAYRGQNVAIVGGGNTAVEDAIYLSKLAKHVTLIHRRDTLRAEQILQKTLKNLSNVSFVWDSEVSEILEENDKFKGVRVLNKKTNASEELVIDGLFVAIGHTPNTSFIKDLLPLTSDGYVDTTDYNMISKGVITKVPGLFVAGDVMDFMDRQAITAAAYGCMAARRALQYLYH